MKGNYCALLLICCALFLCSKTGVFSFADDSSQQVGSEGNKHNTLMPNWVPQPGDMERVEEQRLLAALLQRAQKTLVEAPKDATAWGQVG